MTGSPTDLTVRLNHLFGRKAAVLERKRARF